MSKKIASLVRTGAGFALPLMAAVASAAHKPHRLTETPDVPAAPPEMLPVETAAQVPASFAQGLAHAATHFGFDLESRFLYLLWGVLLGGLVGAFLSDRFRRFRRLIGLAIGVLVLVGVVLIHDYLAFAVGAVVSGIVVFRLLRDKLMSGFEAIFGNAHAATRDEIATAGHVLAYDRATKSYSGQVGIPLGMLVL